MVNETRNQKAIEALVVLMRRRGVLSAEHGPLVALARSSAELMDRYRGEERADPGRLASLCRSHLLIVKELREIVGREDPVDEFDRLVASLGDVGPATT